jgi:hypothetical protein
MEVRIAVLPFSLLGWETRSHVRYFLTTGLFGTFLQSTSLPILLECTGENVGLNLVCIPMVRVFTSLRTDTAMAEMVCTECRNSNNS